MIPLTKAEFAQRLMEQNPDFNRAEAIKLVNQFFEIMYDSLADGRPMEIIGFGKFEIVQRKERMGYNMIMNVKVPIPARQVVVFDSCTKLKTQLNPNRS
jgi:DNA-binding protein HU-beta